MITNEKTAIRKEAQEEFFPEPPVKKKRSTLKSETTVKQKGNKEIEAELAAERKSKRNARKTNRISNCSNPTFKSSPKLSQGNKAELFTVPKVKAAFK